MHIPRIEAILCIIKNIDLEWCNISQIADDVAVPSYFKNMKSGDWKYKVVVTTTLSNLLFQTYMSLLLLFLQAVRCLS